ncbi:MAG: hypothetical protein ACI9J3_002030 [Parvicellaceae bacterium]|jgi:hypothetical protein
MKYIFLVLIPALMFLAGCAKEAGVGGKATVTGVIEQDVYNITGFLHTIGAQNQDIFLTYGVDDQYVDDKLETGYTGDFKIEYLRPGDYTVFTYSDSWTTPIGADSVVLATFSITEKNQELDLGIITIVNRK